MKLDTNNMTSDQIINLVMPALIEDVKSKSFVKDANPTDAEVVGLIVSKFSKWDRDEIVASFIEALEDSNFHADANFLKHEVA